MGLKLKKKFCNCSFCSLLIITDLFGLFLCFKNHTSNSCKINDKSQFIDSVPCMYVCVYIYLYMLAIAGQTAGPNGLTFF